MNKGKASAEYIESLDLKAVPRGTKRKFWCKVVSDAFGKRIDVPVLVARGNRPGPVLGVTAAVHGNELNGVPVIQRLFKEVDVQALSGTLLAIPVVNVPAFMSRKRRFIDSVDLNHIMPGVADGTVSEVYAYRFFHRLVVHMDYLLDLHTASFGRINSYYIRANMEEPTTAEMARLQNARIIVHNPPSDGTLRGAAAERGIPAITLEVGNPNTFQKGMIRSALIGMHNIMSYLEMMHREIVPPDEPIIHCDRSYWIYTDQGGILRVIPDVTNKVKKGEMVAIMHNIFGDIICEVEAPEDGVIIGKSINPINQTGGRIVHLGIISGK